MIRLHVVTEGATEELFINDVLAPYLSYRDIYVDAHSITTRRDKRRNKMYRGGLRNLGHLMKDIELWLKQEYSNDNCWVTTMVDLYAFPYNYNDEWKNGFESKQTGLQKAIFLEQMLRQKFSAYERFIPYVQLHEYEALLLTDTRAIHTAFVPQANDSQLTHLDADIDRQNPEDVNSGWETAPSKRIIRHYPQYDDSKATYGTLIAGEIGIDRIRQACPHFDAWLSYIEGRLK